eukprot:TRINITY_DN50619_c0_g1_i1.p1 TRINITY_DN50619_c0_g1~~TRINITY_DN50619_c0_g1_i1.p1  ORF type:complete len:176 (-),score=28.97 TRINITY_DN50619_c0_g1_i1:10-507(-)
MCNDGNVCTTDQCNSATGCFYGTRDCSLEEPFATLAGDCQQADCDPIGVPADATDSNPNSTNNLPRQPGCFLSPFSDSTVDECGVCNGDGSTCAAGLGDGAAAGIGIGAVIGIILGLILLTACGIFTGKKSYDYYKNNIGDISNGEVNPTFVENPYSGQNQMYEN